MPEALPNAEVPGWIAGLPDTLKTNETFSKFKTVGDFANDYLATQTKAAELQKRVENSVPKLPDDATDEDRNLYYDALGRPKQSSEYEFDQEDKNAPEWTTQWKQQFHNLGLTKAQGKQLSSAFNATMTKMVEAHNAKIATEIKTATDALKSEWGDKFDTNAELAKRVYQKHIGHEFDKDFDAGTGTTRLATLRLLFKMAALTGEDRSPVGAGQPTGNGAAKAPFIDYSKSPAPPARR